jgi:hypothetical protein
MSFIKNYYPILLESLLFVCLLSLFEYILYYLVLAPDNEVIIQNKVNTDVKKALDFDMTNVEYPDKLKEELEKQPLMAKLALDYIKSDNKVDLRKTGYRYYLEQLDANMSAENKIRRYGVTVLIFILFLLLFIFVLYGRFIIKVNFNMSSIAYSIGITFTLIVMMQLYFIYKVSPQLKVVNDQSIAKAIYGFLLGKPLQLAKMPNNNTSPINNT